MRACTCSLAPWPTPTMAMTAPTPMMIPSMVRMDRILLRVRARRATRTIETKSISKLYRAVGLLETQSFDGIQLSRLLGGVIAEEDADAGGEQRGDDDGDDRDIHGPLGDGRDEPGGAEAEEDADGAANR